MYVIKTITYFKNILRTRRMNFELAIIPTLFWKAKLKLPRIANMCIFPKSIIKISNNAMIDLRNANFNINASWTKGRQRRFVSELIVSEGANLSIQGNFSMYQGASIYVAKNAALTIGGNSFINTNSTINCFCKIHIGDNVIIGDNVQIQDSDNHQIIQNGTPSHNNTQPITISNHVWIGRGAQILKGVTIGENSVIGAGAVVSKNIPANCLVAGVPAKIIKENITWQ